MNIRFAINLIWYMNLWMVSTLKWNKASSYVFISVSKFVSMPQTLHKIESWTATTQREERKNMVHFANHSTQSDLSDRKWNFLVKKTPVAPISIKMDYSEVFDLILCLSVCFSFAFANENPISSIAIPNWNWLQQLHGVWKIFDAILNKFLVQLWTMQL